MAAASAAPKSAAPSSLQPAESARVRFAVAGLEDMRDSFSLAMNWMSQPWERHFERIERAAAARTPDYARETRIGTASLICHTRT